MLSLLDGREHTADVAGDHIRAHWCGPKLWVLREWPSGRSVGARATSYAQARLLVAWYDTTYCRPGVGPTDAHAHEKGA